MLAKNIEAIEQRRVKRPAIEVVTPYTNEYEFLKRLSQEAENNEVISLEGMTDDEIIKALFHS